MADTTSLKLPEELKDRVGKVAQRVEQTPHAYMVQAISEKVARDEKHQAFLESARKSREELKSTGILYEHEDVMRFMKDIAAGKKPAKPKPTKVRKSGR
jgi:predicted transcriptional regulator